MGLYKDPGGYTALVTMAMSRYLTKFFSGGQVVAAHIHKKKHGLKTLDFAYFFYFWVRDSKNITLGHLIHFWP